MAGHLHWMKQQKLKKKMLGTKARSEYGSSNSIIVLFTFVIITVKMMNKMLLECERIL
jgi:hypothetical protein